MSAVDFEQFIERLALASGEAILPFFRMNFGVDSKSATEAFDPVTEADRTGEMVMRRLIESTFPLHGIIGEEFGSVRPDAEYVWILDPIDGTRSFIAGIPTWGTLIGLTHRGRPSFGYMHQPFIGERFWGDGHSAFWIRSETRANKKSSRPLRSREGSDLSKAHLMTTNPLMFTSRKRQAYERIASQVRLVRYSADCYAFAMVAAGCVDVVVETELQPYDIAALIPIVTGAGGIITDWQGGSPDQGGDIVASANQALHEKVLKELT